MPKAKEREIGFEESMSALEKIVAQLESGELPLERALELFEEGVGLARRCQSQLEEAERKVELLLRERGEVKAVPFETARDAPVNDAAGPAQLSASAPRAAAIAGMDLDDEDQEDDINDSIPF